MSEEGSEKGESATRLPDGRTYPDKEMHKFRELMEKHTSLLNSADPDKKLRGFEMINDEGRDCTWHVHGESGQVADELSTLWNQLAEYSRSINLESLDDEEDDGGMERKLYDQIVDYFKSGKIAYENYSAGDMWRTRANWERKCSSYSLANDGKSLKKGEAFVLKKGEVNNVLKSFHQITGHSYVDEIIPRLLKLLYVNNMRQKYRDLLASCSCGHVAEVNLKAIQILIDNIVDGGRSVLFYSANFGVGSCEKRNLPMKNLETKALYSLSESAYQKELIQSRSSQNSKFRISGDGRTLLTLSGAVVLKDDEAMNVCMRIHELCGHPRLVELRQILSRFVFLQRKEALCTTITKNCNFCRCKRSEGSIIQQSPVNVQNIKLDIKVHYDEGAVERRFEIVLHGVDSKAIDHYVNDTIGILKKYGKWKEPVFSPAAALARSVLRVVDLLRGEQKEEIENVIDFDPIRNDTVSDEDPVRNFMEDPEAESESGSVTESLVDGEISGEEEEKMEGEDEEEEEMIDEEEDGSDLEDEEVRQMRRELEEMDRESEFMENEARRFADSTGKMRAYVRQWEFSDFLREQIEIDENPQRRRMLDEDDSGEEEDGEVEKKDVKESDKEDTTACEEGPSTSGLGQPEEEDHVDSNEKKKGGKKKKNKKKKRKGGQDNASYDLPPYKANYEEKNEKEPDTTNTVQMERVEREMKEMKPVSYLPAPVSRDDHPVRKRGRLAQMRREKEELERNTKKEEEKKVLPVYNPYAAAFNGNSWPEEQMEKIRRMREERERRKEAGLTESEEDEEYEE